MIPNEIRSSTLVYDSVLFGEIDDLQRAINRWKRADESFAMGLQKQTKSERNSEIFESILGKREKDKIKRAEARRERLSRLQLNMVRYH